MMLLVRLFWVPYYLDCFTPEEVIRNHTPAEYQQLTNEGILLLAGDTTEIRAQASELLERQKDMYSTKYAHTNTVKDGFIVCMDGTILTRLPCYGGGTSEAEALAKFLSSEFVKNCKYPVALFLDRGLRDLLADSNSNSSKNSNVRIILPSMLGGRAQFETEEAVRTQVQQIFRHGVEKDFHWSKSFQHLASFKNVQLPIVEEMLDIIAATVNAVTLKLQPKLTDVESRQCKQLEKMLDEQVDHTKEPPLSISSPTVTQVNLLQTLKQSLIPDDWSQILQERKNGAIMKPISEQGISLSLKMKQKIPEKRAKKLYEANYLGLLQLGTQASNVVVHARVHASQKSADHCVLIEFPIDAPRDFKAICDCEYG